MTTALIQHISEQTGIACKNAIRVSGGDINDSYKIETSEEPLFLKLNMAEKYPAMFEKEAEGLAALANAKAFYIPAVVAHGQFEHHQYLVMEWLEKGLAGKHSWKDFAMALANLHRNTNDRFGFHSSNYIGSLVQANDWKNSWEDFYATQRILPLVKQLVDVKRLESKDAHHAEMLCAKLGSIFPAEAPSLLHGDLWAGNFMAVKHHANESIPAIFDPAVYYGHREMDIGMTLLFGGYDKTMYAYYNELYPLEKNWQQRVELTQLYPLLVHAILFGGGYVSQCRMIISKWGN